MPKNSGQEGTLDLPTIRRYEAAGLRAWPAQTASYDGTWVVRQTVWHPARRLNSVTPLDPSDDHRIEERVEILTDRFRKIARTPTFRLSPLAAPAISKHLDACGWSFSGQSLVMGLRLDEEIIGKAMDQIPLQDTRRFVNATMATHDYDSILREGLHKVIDSIKPELGLFVLEDEAKPVATAICVQDGALAGLFELATTAKQRGKGYGRRALLSALKWAHSHGARKAWLQVESENDVAIKLYRALGFRTIYEYHYRQAPEPNTGRQR